MYLKLLFIITLSLNIFAKEIKTNSLVKIFTTTSVPNYLYPWQTSKISHFTGSGAIISNNRILTSAHVVSSAKLIEIKKENDPKRYLAKVKYISHQADLAVLELIDKNFFKNTSFLTLTDKIKTRDAVTVLGYPVGGNNISTTTGIISRIEYRRYVWSSKYLLTIQIDAAINPGNSGGPVVNDKNELIGIAMMKLRKSSNIAYIVPTYIINTFLEDCKDGKIDGFASSNIYTQKINNDTLKKYYNLNKRTGILVTKVSNEEKVLKENDIILSIDNKDIANDGTIKTKYSRLSFIYALNSKQIGENIKLKILRNKIEIYLDYTLRNQESLIKYEFEQEPRYVIYGGFAFTPLSKNYSYKNPSLEKSFYQKEITKDYTEVVASLNTIFPHKVNRGYYLGAKILTKVNDINIKSFKHLLYVLDNVKSEFTIFEFLENKKIILNTKEAKNSFKDLKDIYHLNSDKRE